MKKITLCFLLLSFISSTVWSQPGCSDGTNQPIYNITFQSTWNATEHSSIPAGAHWSDVIMIYHSTPNQFLEFGQPASLGIKNLAELGDNTELYNEVAASAPGTVDQMTVIPFTSTNNATATAEGQVALCQDQRYMTILSMVAPSPDWFIAVNSLDVLALGLDTPEDMATIDVYAYDAGTDNGTNYNSPDSPNTPVGISLITGAPINGNKIGTLTIQFVTYLLNTPTFETTKTLKIAPNPSKGHISINGDNVANLQSVKVYNILGSLVKDLAVNTTQNKLNLDLSTLNKGIYLVKLNTKNGETTTQKLIIE